VLVKTLKVQLVRPPVAVCVSAGTARERALGFVIHHGLLSCFADVQPIGRQSTQRFSSGKVDFSDRRGKFF
jgi:hypothetical protein